MLNHTSSLCPRWKANNWYSYITDLDPACALGLAATVGGGRRGFGDDGHAGASGVAVADVLVVADRDDAAGGRGAGGEGDRGVHWRRGGVAAARGGGGVSLP